MDETIWCDAMRRGRARSGRRDLAREGVSAPGLTRHVRAGEARLGMQRHGVFWKGKF